MPDEPKPTPPANSLSGQEVLDTGAKIGKDAVKTAAVWTLASLMTNGIRSLFKQVKLPK